MFKKIVIFGLTILCATALAQISGIKTVGVGGDYPTLTAALTTAPNSWKNSTITGDVIFRLLDTIYPNETYPLVCTIPAGYTGGDWNLLIKPVSGNVAKLIGSNATAIFELTGIDRLTMDSLIIANLNLGTDTAGHAIRFINGASFNTVKNCELRAASKLVSSLAGGVIYFSTAESPSGPGNNNNLVDNCLITSSQTDRFPVYAITIRGTSPMYTRTNNNNTVQHCKIIDFSAIGVYFSAYDSNTTITENEFYSTVAQNTLQMIGIRITATSVCNTKITKNKFFDFRAAEACTCFMAIYMTMADPDKPPLVANNFISLDGNVTHPNTKIYGIRLLRQETTADTYKFYNNSIYIGGTPTSKSSYGFFCKPSASLQTKIDFRNNIIFNNRSGGTGKHYCIYDSLASTLSFYSDYNNLYVATPGSNGQYVAYRNGIDLATLTDWQTATARDSHSISLNPNYVSTTDLHINSTSSNVNNLAIPISYITTDIDGETRNAVTPDIGADEYTPGAACQEPITKSQMIYLQSTYPNPFHTHTTICYALTTGENVTLSIYDVSGKLIRNLVDQHQTAGNYAVTWNGKDNHGLKMPNGIYIRQLKIEKEIKHSQIILIK